MPQQTAKVKGSRVSRKAKSAAEGLAASGRKRGKTAKNVEFLEKPSCTTCRKARSFMQRRGFKLRFRNLDKNRLSVNEIEDLIGSRDHSEFLNPRSRSYEESGLGEAPSRREAVRAMAKQPNLLRRPIIVAGGRVVVGFDKNGILKL